MKKLLITLSLLFCLVLATRPAHAQGKAYDNVKYTARLKGTTLLLTYADGYLGASQIRIRSGQKNMVLIPDNGSPGDNGDLRFYPKTMGNMKPEKTDVLLKNIDELTEAPPTIRGVYHMNGKVHQLLFKQTK